MPIRVCVLDPPRSALLVGVGVDDVLTVSEVVVVAEEEGIVMVEVVVEDVTDEDDMDADGNERVRLALATLQNCCARSSAVFSSEAHWAEMHVTISFVKLLLQKMRSQKNN